jgi:predicted RNase H-like HicB family nuclease
MTPVPSERKGVSYRAVFQLDTASGVLAVAFPDLPDCSGEGDDFVQALDFAKRSLDAWIDASLQRGETVSAATRREPTRPTAPTFWIAAGSAVQQRRIQSPRPSS